MDHGRWYGRSINGFYFIGMTPTRWHLNALSRRFGTEEGKCTESMDYPSFAVAIARAGFHLSTSETKKVFNKFRLTGESGESKRLMNALKHDVHDHPILWI